MERQVGYVKDNAVTRMADQIKSMNAERGSMAGKFTGSPVQLISGPRVSSAAMLAAPVPLPPEEQAELDSKAREIGILPVEEEGGEYSSFEAAARAGESINPPAPTPPPSHQAPSARELLAAPRMLDFTKIQGINLMTGVAYVDNFELEIPAEKLKEFKQYVLRLTKDYVKAQLDKAMAAIDPPVESEDSAG